MFAKAKHVNVGGRLFTVSLMQHNNEMCAMVIHCGEQSMAGPYSATYILNRWGGTDQWILVFLSTNGTHVPMDYALANLNRTMDVLRQEVVEISAHVLSLDTQAFQTCVKLTPRSRATQIEDVSPLGQ